MTKSAFLTAVALISAALALTGCEVSTAGGNRNAATNPASGIFVSNTVGGGDVSQRFSPMVSFRAPSNKAPSPLPAGQTAAVKSVESQLTGGCWENSHVADLYGAYDQIFWWPGTCDDSVASVTIELYASAAKARASEQHPASSTLLARYIEGSVLVDVWGSSETAAVTTFNGLKGLQLVPGLGDANGA